MNASRRTRRRFAAPLVMTLVLPACTVTTGAGTPPTTTTPTTTTPTPGDGAGVTPMVNPPPPAAPETWTVSMNADGSCAASRLSDCPEGTRCNPPPPARVECPAGLTAGATATVTSDPTTGTCTAVLPTPSCPPNTMCNPPPPQPTACPQ